jgi:hypothetical protein
VTIVHELLSLLGLIGAALGLLGGLEFVRKLGQYVGQPPLIAGPSQGNVQR